MIMMKMMMTMPYEFFVCKPVRTLASKAQRRIHVFQHVIPNYCHIYHWYVQNHYHHQNWQHHHHNKRVHVLQHVISGDINHHYLIHTRHSTMFLIAVCFFNLILSLSLFHFHFLFWYLLLNSTFTFNLFNSIFHLHLSIFTF